MRERYERIEETYSNPRNYPIEIQESPGHQHQTEDEHPGQDEEEHDPFVGVEDLAGNHLEDPERDQRDGGARGQDGSSDAQGVAAQVDGGPDGATGAVCYRWGKLVSPWLARNSHCMGVEMTRSTLGPIVLGFALIVPIGLAFTVL